MWRHDKLQGLGEVEVRMCGNCDFGDESIGQRIRAEWRWRQSSGGGERVAANQRLAGRIRAAARWSNVGRWHRTIDGTGGTDCGSWRNIGSWGSCDSGNSMVDGWRLRYRLFDFDRLDWRGRSNGTFRASFFSRWRRL